MPSEASDVSRLLDAWSAGEPDALDDLMPLVYDELHKIASRHLRREAIDHTLQPTALVNEVYLKFKDQRKVRWTSQNEFFAVAARKARHILVDHARARKSKKRGGEVLKVPLEEEIGISDDKNPGLIALDDALQDLARLHPRQSRILELRIFGGFTLEEIVALEGHARSTISRDWDVAVRWLRRALTAR